METEVPIGSRPRRRSILKLGNAMNDDTQDVPLQQQPTDENAPPQSQNINNTTGTITLKRRVSFVSEPQIREIPLVVKSDDRTIIGREDMDISFLQSNASGSQFRDTPLDVNSGDHTIIGKEDMDISCYSRMDVTELRSRKTPLDAKSGDHTIFGKEDMDVSSFSQSIGSVLRFRETSLNAKSGDHTITGKEDMDISALSPNTTFGSQSREIPLVKAGDHTILGKDMDISCFSQSIDSGLQFGETPSVVKSGDRTIIGKENMDISTYSHSVISGPQFGETPSVVKSGDRTIIGKENMDISTYSHSVISGPQFGVTPLVVKSGDRTIIGKENMDISTYPQSVISGPQFVRQWTGNPPITIQTTYGERPAENYPHVPPRAKTDSQFLLRNPNPAFVQKPSIYGVFGEAKTPRRTLLPLKSKTVLPEAKFKVQTQEHNESHDRSVEHMRQLVYHEERQVEHPSFVQRPSTAGSLLEIHDSSITDQSIIESAHPNTEHFLKNQETLIGLDKTGGITGLHSEMFSPPETDLDKLLPLKSKTVLPEAKFKVKTQEHNESHDRSVEHTRQLAYHHERQVEHPSFVQRPSTAGSLLEIHDSSIADQWIIESAHPNTNHFLKNQETLIGLDKTGGTPGLHSEILSPPETDLDKLLPLKSKTVLHESKFKVQTQEHNESHDRSVEHIKQLAYHQESQVEHPSFVQRPSTAGSLLKIHDSSITDQLIIESEHPNTKHFLKNQKTLVGLDKTGGIPGLHSEILSPPETDLDKLTKGHGAVEHPSFAHRYSTVETLPEFTTDQCVTHNAHPLPRQMGPSTKYLKNHETLSELVKTGGIPRLVSEMLSPPETDLDKLTKHHGAVEHPSFEHRPSAAGTLVEFTTDQPVTHSRHPLPRQMGPSTKYLKNHETLSELVKTGRNPRLVSEILSPPETDLEKLTKLHGAVEHPSFGDKHSAARTLVEFTTDQSVTHSRHPLFRQMGPNTKYYLKNHETLSGLEKIMALSGLEGEILSASETALDKLIKRHGAAFHSDWEDMMRSCFNLQKVMQIPFCELGNESERIKQLLGQ